MDESRIMRYRLYDIPLVFALTLGAMVRIAHEHGSLEKVNAALLSDNLEESISAAAYLAEVLSDEGQQLAKFDGQETGRIDARSVMHLAPSRLPELRSALIDALRNGLRREIESEKAVGGKNAEAGQRNPKPLPG